MPALIILAFIMVARAVLKLSVFVLLFPAHPLSLSRTPAENRGALGRFTLILEKKGTRLGVDSRAGLKSLYRWFLPAGQRAQS